MKNLKVGDTQNKVFIQFGDGLVAEVRDSFPPYEDEYGNLKKKFYVAPEPLFFQIYEIKDDELIVGGFLEVILPNDSVWIACDDPKATRFKTELNWRGQDTVESIATLRMIIEEKKVGMPIFPIKDEKEFFDYIKKLNTTLNMFRIKTLLERLQFLERENKGFRISNTSLQLNLQVARGQRNIDVKNNMDMMREYKKAMKISDDATESEVKQYE